MIKVDQLTKRYGNVLAVDSISFEAKTGEIVGLLGANGAGKTTTMRMLTGFLPPTEGTAHINGHDIQTDSMEARRNIGYMPERIPIYPDMTVKAYVIFWAQLRGSRRPTAHTEAVLKRVQLYDRRDTLVRHLSKGMRQRLGLAQALVHSPPVIILDEPTIGIDPKQLIEVRETIQSLGKDHTVLLSTHILSEAEQVCDRVLIIDKGQIIAQGKPSDLHNQLRGNASYYVEIGNADKAKARTLITNLDTVSRLENKGKGFIVHAKPNADPRAEITGKIAEAGFTLLEMRQEQTSLEAVFLALVEDTPSSEGER